INLDKLSADIGQLQQKLVDAKSRQKALILRGRTAKSRMGVKRQLHDVDIDEAMSKFDRYERRIDDLEGEIEAYDLGQKNLADEIAELESDEKVDEELAKLKARLGQDATASDDTADTKSEES
ncbi:MAG: PspA/IM30 family protein, partial [Proteobacteria bacterium]|nr:PspA/IM30 family protein [Pseudomonadota bacterium]